MNGETIDNDVQPISTWRIPVNKKFMIIGGGLLVVALVVAFVSANMSAQRTEITPTNTSTPASMVNNEITPANASALPDLLITAANVSTVDNNGFCLSYYGFNVTVVNQGDAPALDVMLADNTGQEVVVGTLNPLERASMSFVPHAKSGAYTVIADPHNVIAESDESNNSATFSQATATAIASCPLMQFGGTPTPVATSTPFQAGSAATMDSKVALRESLIQVLGTDKKNEPRLRKISYSDPEAGDITITWALDDSAPQSSAKAAAQIDATAILKSLKDSQSHFIYVILIGTFSTQDKHGNMAETQAVSLGFNKSKLDKINWGDFQYSDVYDLADLADIAGEWK
jgi:hypothetical protein